ncbi:TlpA disulfide reductase family protein [Chitinophaga sp. YIM B06452]|uniref:TlpA disulfide reductase family protein n=1 Tax=Chitinophaga sp. YIM B06452 TaxID=3082158 RepID=UPI0031FE8D62
MTKFLLPAFLLVATAGANHAYAQSGKPAADTTERYYARLARSSDEADKSKLEAQLYALIQSSKDERDWLTARRFFYMLNKQKVSDSITGRLKTMFPLGEVVREEEVTVVYNEKDALKKEAAYKKWVAKFPPTKPWKDSYSYDYAAHAVANAFMEAGDLKKMMVYADKIQSPVWKPEGLTGLSQRLAAKGNTKEAAVLCHKARALALSHLSAKSSDQGANGFVKAAYVTSSSILAEISYKEKKYDQALKYITEARDSSDRMRPNINFAYANILAALGRNSEAFNVLDETVQAGFVSAPIKKSLQELYVKVKGSSAGYDEYMAALNKKIAEKVRADLAKQIINTPAPTFTLSDVNGKSVSLADLKGKIVVLDFWATWCGPCKRSFPAMKTAMEKFKDDKDVRFLFIHTWEKEEDATEKAKQYVVENNYPFEVLMDLKDAGTGTNKVVTDYKVSAIPTKFVIDRNGNIRFKFTGAGSTDDIAVEEVSAMIEMARK